MVTHKIGERYVPEQEIVDWMYKYGYKYTPKVYRGHVDDEVIGLFDNYNGMSCRNPFLVVDVNVSMSNDFGQSASFRSEICIDVKSVNEGELLADILNRSPFSQIRPNRLMFPNHVVKDYKPSE